MAVNNRILRDFRRFQKASCLRKSGKEYFGSSVKKVMPGAVRVKSPKTSSAMVEKTSERSSGKAE